MFKTHRTYSLSTGMKGTTIAVVQSKQHTFVLYHDTIVFEQYANGDITISNGGWDTVSTRIVINRALEQTNCKAYLFRQKNKTYISINGQLKEFHGCEYFSGQESSEPSLTHIGKSVLSIVSKIKANR